MFGREATLQNPGAGAKAKIVTMPFNYTERVRLSF